MQRYTSEIKQNISLYDPTALSFLQNATAGMLRSGIDQFTARMRALKLLDLTIFREAAVTAYNHVFALVAILFLVAIPFVLFLRTSREAGEAELIIE